MGASFDKAKEIFLEHEGILRSSEAQRLGVHPQILTRMVNAGVLIKEERGLYRLEDLDPMIDLNLVQVAMVVPKSVICLISALSFHTLTTQIPRKVYISLPNNIKKPRLRYPPLDIVWLSKKPYSAGIVHHRIGRIDVRIYNREKTVADCFKFRMKIGEDIAIEALKDYLQDEKRSIDQLLHYAEVNRVRTIMDPYLKALTI